MCSAVRRLLQGGRCTCYGVHAHAERRGLDGRSPNQGYAMRYGDAHTPVDMGFTRRFDATGTVETALYVPPIDDARITNPTAYREASPTGKPSGGEMFARLSPQNFDGVQANTLLSLSARQTPPAARKVTREQIDPWASTQGKTSWMPGQMARQTVSG